MLWSKHIVEIIQSPILFFLQTRPKEDRASYEHVYALVKAHERDYPGGESGDSSRRSLKDFRSKVERASTRGEEGMADEGGRASLR